MSPEKFSNSLPPPPPPIIKLLTEREQRGDSQCDSGRNGLGLDPEGDPRHDNDESGRDVRMEKVVAETPS